MLMKHTKMGWKQWLFEPFMYVAGVRALVVGLFAIMAIGLLGSITTTHFDGVLDVHIGAEAPIWFFILEGLVDWLCLSLVLIVSGTVFARSRFRIVDLLGTQALSRWPGLIVVLMLLISPLRDAFNRVNDYILRTSMNPAASGAIGALDTLLFGVTILVVLLVIGWTVILMYRAYRVSCDVKGFKAIASFLPSLLVAELMSKLALWQIGLRL